MSNLGFEQALSRSEIPFARAPVGDRYVLETMQQKGWILGGENSGHIICLDKHTTGDAIVAALAVLRALCEQKTTLAAATADAAAVSAAADQRADTQRLRLERERRHPPRASATRSPCSTDPAACCCGPPAPSRCCVSWSRPAKPVVAERCAQGIAEVVAKAAA